MSAAQDANAKISLGRALEARSQRELALADFADQYLRYIRDALQAGWSWRRIGEGLNISEQAVKRYWQTHRQRAGRLPSV